MYIITFTKAQTPDKALTEQFDTLFAAKRWEKVVKQNGYIVVSRKKLREQVA